MKHGEEHVQRWILTFILTPTRFKWLCLYPNEDISLPFQYILRIWEEVRLSDLNLGVTGTLLSFVGTLLFSHVLWHHEGKGEEEEGERNHRKIDRVQLWETRKKKSMGGKWSIFASLIFTAPKPCLLHYHWSHFIFFWLLFSCRGCTTI